MAGLRVVYEIPTLPMHMKGRRDIDAMPTKAQVGRELYLTMGVGRGLQPKVLSIAVQRFGRRHR